MPRKRREPTHLDRQYILDVYAGGVLVVRRRKDPPRDGTLPVFSVNTQNEAEAIQAAHCTLSRQDNNTYRLNPRFRTGKDGTMTLDDLYGFEAVLTQEYAAGRYDYAKADA